MVLLPIPNELIGTLNAELAAFCAKSSAPTVGPQLYHSPVRRKPSTLCGASTTCTIRVALVTVAVSGSVGPVLKRTSPFCTAYDGPLQSARCVPVRMKVLSGATVVLGGYTVLLARLTRPSSALRPPGGR